MKLFPSAKLTKNLHSRKYYWKKLTKAWFNSHHQGLKSQKSASNNTDYDKKYRFLLEFEIFFLILHSENITLYKNIMNAVIERTPRSVTVRMSTRRWNRMLELEQTYKLARIINRSMNQVESEPSMTPQEAIDSLRALWGNIYDKADMGNISDVYLRELLKRME